MSQSPIHKLPNELLLKIFTIYCLYEDNNHYYRPPSVHRLPLDISHICVRWSRLMLSTSKLWSRIHFRYFWLERNIPSQVIHRHVSLIKLYLRRSTNALLCIDVQMMHGFSDAVLENRNREDTLGALFDVLLAEAHRWQNATIAITRAHLHRLHFPTCFPELRAFAFLIVNDEDGNVMPEFAAPSLRSLQISQAICVSRGVISHLSSLLLRHVKISDMFLLVIEQACNLETLYLRDIVGSEDFQRPDAHIPCMSRILEIQSGDAGTLLPDPIGLFFSSIFLLRLDSLSVRGPDCLDPIRSFFPTIQLQQLFRRSPRCNLTAFKISLYFMQDNELLLILAELPSLTSLSIDERHPTTEPWSSSNGMFTDDFFSRLSILPVHPPESLFLLKLSRLELYFQSYSYSYSPRARSAFYDMLQSRCPSRYTLTTDSNVLVVDSSFRHLLLHVPKRELVFTQSQFSRLNLKDVVLEFNGY